MTAAVPIATWPRRVLLVGVTLAGYLFVYWLIDHLPRRAHLLPLSPLERTIPFLPWTVWPYLILDATVIVLPLLIRDRRVFADTFVAACIGLLLSATIWSLWPTVYPRPAAPSGESLAGVVYAWLCRFDGPANCFPSGHVVMPSISAWGLTRDRRAVAIWVWLGVALLAPSLLTLKQHYLLDIAAGVLVAALSALLARRLRSIALRKSCGLGPGLAQEVRGAG